MRQALTEALIAFDGALIVVSHDRHLLRSTTDEFYRIHQGQVEPFDGDLADYQKWLIDQNKQQHQQIRQEQLQDKMLSGNLTAQDRKEQNDVKQNSANARNQSENSYQC